MTEIVKNGKDKVTFAEEPAKTNKALSGTWKVLVVDDEEDVHAATHLILDNVVFMDKKIEIIDTYGEEDTKNAFKNHSDIALVLLDVVMDTNDSGLKLVKYIREVVKNPFVRVVLRTGQPGAAPEREVILNYDINDYKAKTELTSEKLFTSVISSLRTFQSMMEVENYRKNLENMVNERTKKLQKIKDDLQQLVDLTI